VTDHPANSFALGYLAAGSATELANDVAMTIVHGRRETQAELHINNLLAENQALRNDNAHLRAVNASVEEYVSYLEGWGDRLYAELVKIKGR